MAVTDDNHGGSSCQSSKEFGELPWKQRVELAIGASYRLSHTGSISTQLGRVRAAYTAVRCDGRVTGPRSLDRLFALS